MGSHVENIRSELRQRFAQDRFILEASCHAMTENSRRRFLLDEMTEIVEFKIGNNDEDDCVFWSLKTKIVNKVSINDFDHTKYIIHDQS